MEWITNAKWNQPLESASIWRLKPNENVVIHKIHGYGEGLYLTCHDLHIDTQDLRTANFDDAVIKSREIIGKRVNELFTMYAPFATDTSKSLFTRY